MEVPDQGLQLVGIHLELVKPGLEPPARQSLLTEPKPLAVVAQELEGRLAAVAKNKHGPRKWVCFEHLAADVGKAVDAFAEVDRFRAGKDAHLRADLDHRPWLTKQLMMGARPEAAAASISIFSSKPAGERSCTTHGESENKGGAFTSTNSKEVLMPARC